MRLACQSFLNSTILKPLGFPWGNRQAGSNMNDVKISQAFKNAVKTAAKKLGKDNSKVSLEHPYDDFFVTKMPEPEAEIFQTFTSEELIGEKGSENIFVVCQI